MARLSLVSRSILALGILAAGTLASERARAWGASGHRMIGEIAARNFPAELPSFLRGLDIVREIGELAREPDRSKGAGVPHDADLDPGHFVDVGDDLLVLDGPSLSKLPATRELYDTALRAAGSDQYKAGYLPYSIIEGWQQLVQDFAYWRSDLAAAKLSSSASDRHWFETDRALREMLTIRDLGVWSHFVGDGSQPMHVSVHFNGWGKYPNPEHFSNQRGLHARFEGAFVRKAIDEDDIDPLLAPYRDCGCAVAERVGQYLTATNGQVIALYRLEKASAFDGAPAQGKAFVAARLAAGASELRDLVLDAWRASAMVSIGYPPVAVRDIETGRADALTAFRGAD